MGCVDNEGPGQPRSLFRTFATQSHFIDYIEKQQDLDQTAMTHKQLWHFDIHIFLNINKRSFLKSDIKIYRSITVLFVLRVKFTGSRCVHGNVFLQTLGANCFNYCKHLFKRDVKTNSKKLLSLEVYPF